MSGFGYINRTYGLSVKRGTRVRFTGRRDSKPRTGRVVGTDGALLRIRLDGDNRSDIYHPTWKLEILTGDEKGGENK